MSEKLTFKYSALSAYFSYLSDDSYYDHHVLMIQKDVHYHDSLHVLIHYVLRLHGTLHDSSIHLSIDRIRHLQDYTK